MNARNPLQRQFMALFVTSRTMSNHLTTTLTKQR